MGDEGVTILLGSQINGPKEMFIFPLTSGNLRPEANIEVRTSHPKGDDDIEFSMG